MGVELHLLCVWGSAADCPELTRHQHQHWTLIIGSATTVVRAFTPNISAILTASADDGQSWTRQTETTVIVSCTAGLLSWKWLAPSLRRWEASEWVVPVTVWTVCLFQQQQKLLLCLIIIMCWENSVPRVVLQGCPSGVSLMLWVWPLINRPRLSQVSGTVLGLEQCCHYNNLFYQLYRFLGCKSALKTLELKQNGVQRTWHCRLGNVTRLQVLLCIFKLKCHEYSQKIVVIFSFILFDNFEKVISFLSVSKTGLSHNLMLANIKVTSNSFVHESPVPARVFWSSCPHLQCVHPGVSSWNDDCVGQLSEILPRSVTSGRPCLRDVSQQLN